MARIRSCWAKCSRRFGGASVENVDCRRGDKSCRRSLRLLFYLYLLFAGVSLGVADGSDRRPNILLLITDDQDVLIGGTDHMPHLQRFLAEQGTTFTNAFVHTPVCCPSRTSILTGRYLHNGLALNNSVTGNCNGPDWQQNAEHETFAVAAQRAGYRTAYAGKYLNQYGTKTSPGCPTGNEIGCFHVPPGWDRWLGLVGNSRYYNYSTVVSNDGGASTSVYHHGTDFGKDYLPDLVANRTLDVLREFAKDKDDDRPFLMTVAWPTPHAPFTPAPRDQGSFPGLKAYKTPNYNATGAQNAAKHWMMRRLAPIDAATEQWIDNVHRLRAQALQSVDRHIARFVAALQENGQLDNTYIIYTSDNGWQSGQHRLEWDKRQLYEHDIRVPLVVRGPDVASNTTCDAVVLSIDLAPTLLNIVHDGNSNDSSYEVPPKMDGRSFLPLLLGSDNNQSLTTTTWRRDFLVSYHGEADPACGMWSCPPPPPEKEHGMNEDAFNNTYHCVRTLYPTATITADVDSSKSDHDSIINSAPGGRNTMFCRFDDDEHFVEYYNLDRDPWQLDNAVHELTVEERFALEARLVQLKRCHGASCRNHDTLVLKSPSSC